MGGFRPSGDRGNQCENGGAGRIGESAGVVMEDEEWLVDTGESPRGRIHMGNDTKRI